MTGRWRCEKPRSRRDRHTFVLRDRYAGSESLWHTRQRRIRPFPPRHSGVPVRVTQRGTDAATDALSDNWPHNDSRLPGASFVVVSSPYNKESNHVDGASLRNGGVLSAIFILSEPTMRRRKRIRSKLLLCFREYPEPQLSHVPSRTSPSFPNTYLVENGRSLIRPLNPRDD